MSESTVASRERDQIHRANIGPFRIDRDYYTSGQAARLLGIPDRTIRRYLAIGRLDGSQHPITGTWQISRQALRRFIRKSGCDAVDSLPQPNVFVVNDDAIMTSFLVRAFERAMPRAAVKSSDNPCDSLIKMGCLHPDLIIVKARMRLLHARDIIPPIRSNQETTRAKVLVVGGLPDERVELVALGADDTLGTPFTYPEFTDRVRSLLPEHFENEKTESSAPDA